nr:MAG TPA: hypothetical protein [Caudoviricetes sp.]
MFTIMRYHNSSSFMNFYNFRYRTDYIFTHEGFSIIVFHTSVSLDTYST